MNLDRHTWHQYLFDKTVLTKKELKMCEQNEKLLLK